MHDLKIGFIGGGNMARSLAGGLVADGFPPSRIIVSEPDTARRDALASRFGIPVTRDNLDVADGADVIVLAVKPQVMAEVARGIAPALARHSPLVVSIAAGVRTSDLSDWLGGTRPWCARCRIRRRSCDAAQALCSPPTAWTRNSGSRPSPCSGRSAP
jgi:pyrroline-5-carboxylate reductase